MKNEIEIEDPVLFKDISNCDESADFVMEKNNFSHPIFTWYVNNEDDPGYTKINVTDCIDNIISTDVNEFNFRALHSNPKVV